MSRSKRREREPLFDRELAELPEGARWREWLATLRDLSDLERLEDEGLLQRPQFEMDLDEALGLGSDERTEFDATALEKTADDLRSDLRRI
jgi:hypothetical protein